MQTRFDQAIKQMLRMLLEPCGTFTPAMEVSPDPQMADGYFEPDSCKPSSIADTLLGRMTSKRCAFEMFSTTPTRDDASECVRKHMNLRHILSKRGPDEPLPHQWIVSAGFPKEAIGASRGRQTAHWPRGVLALPDMLATSIVVVNQLPEIPSTLLLRLMGRGRTLRRAIADLKRLPENEFQRCATLPILLRYRIEASAVPVLPEEEEYLVNTQEIVEYMIRKHADPIYLPRVQQAEQRAEQAEQQVQRERELAAQAQRERELAAQAQRERELAAQQKQQQVDHERALILRQLTRRFGAVPSHIAERIQAANLETLDKYAEKLVVAPCVEDVIADE